jgi:hypothetical protein
VAFTADKRIGRSSEYCTDVAKAIDCPVIHVHAENIEANANKNFFYFLILFLITLFFKESHFGCPPCIGLSATLPQGHFC